MRNWSKFFVGASVLALAAGCSEKLPDNVTDPGSVNPKDAVFMNVAVQLPVGTGTRSVTNPGGGSDAGTEIGKDYENDVKSILLVIADKDNKFIAFGEHSEDLHTIASGRVSTVHSITKSTLKEYYGEDNRLTEAEREIHVFVFCNPTAELRENLDEISKGTAEQKAKWYDMACKITEEPGKAADKSAIWGGPNHTAGFLMSTADVKAATKKLPADFSEWDSYTSIDKAFNLSGINNAYTDKEIDNGTAVPVERAVARFDFRDGSPADTKANTYDVVHDSEGNLLVSIELQKMALVNMSKEFYYLRRVSETGDNDDAVLGGTEVYDNYVVDTDAASKKDDTIIKNNAYSSYFNFCLGHVDGDSWTIDETARGQWYTSEISDVLKGTEDNDEGWKPGTRDYHIWRYVTENTVPSAVAQKNGITTGVVFKGKMIAAEGAKGSLADALNNAKGGADDAILYSYSNNLYVSWKSVREFAIEAGAGSEMYLAVFGNSTVEPVAEKEAGEDVEAVDAVYSDDTASPDYLWNVWHNENGHQAGHATLSAFKKAATSSKFTLYESSIDEVHGAGYYCYYFYWNRHNDNGNSGLMSPMEFAVVRNNVYKLAVTGINRFGHPRISENNPDPVDPDDPDEKGDVYLTVSVEVLPWTVRVNNIEF